jgi:sulfide dehydrogenase cytochrome subunit
MRPTVKPILAPCSLGLLVCALLSPVAAADDVEEIVESCAACHGPKGVSSHPEVPTIAGYSEYYMSDSLLAYKEEERPCPETEYLSGDDKGEKTTMCKVADDLDEDEIEEVAKYYADQEFVRADQEFDAALAEKGKKIHEENCEKCHSEAGSLPSDDSGILAGQWMPYLKQTFSEFTSGERPMTKKMKVKFEKLDESQKEALLNYYGSFK